MNKEQALKDLEIAFLAVEQTKKLLAVEEETLKDAKWICRLNKCTLQEMFEVYRKVRFPK